MRARVIPERCQGHTQCHLVAPQIFKSQPEDGHAYVDEPEVPVELEELALRAARGCPEEAIVLES